MSSFDTMPPCPPPLHVAIWEGDVNNVRSLLNSVCTEGEESQDPIKAKHLNDLLERKDIHGNSALHLAVRIVQPNQRAIVKLLLDRNASVTSRNSEGWSCAHDAALCDDEFLLAQFYLRGEKQVMQSLESSQATFIQELETLPDFEAEIFVEAQSWVPIVSSVLPSDIIRIWKRGTQLRIDSTLKGLDGVKWKKGPMSHIYLGREGGERVGHAVVMDHENKKYYDVLEAMHNSSVGNLDLALHVSLTTAMSSSSLSAANLEFVKQKEVKAKAVKDENSNDHDEEKRKSRSRLRKCPWPGTTYKILNFSIKAQFRPVVNPDRKLKQLSTNKDTPFEEVQQFVEHLQSSVPHGKANGNSNAKHKRSISDNCKDKNTPQTLRLEKGRKVEMHLDVIAGDTIKWEFMSNSSNFCFGATYFHEDQQLCVCHSDGVKNIKIVGVFEIEHNGNFVLMWQNTQKGFTIDRMGIKITYNVAHIRAAVDVPPGNASLAADLATQGELTSSNSSMLQADTQKMSNGSCRLSDDQKCDFFRQLNHIPNPITTTTAFVDYFRLKEVLCESKESPDDKHCEFKKELSLLFSYTSADNEQHYSQPTTTAPSSWHVGADTPCSGMKNTFRSLTLMPTTRHVRKDFEAKVVMTDSFPFQLRDFLPVIKFMSTTGDHVKNIEEFFQMKLPPGFPVKFKLPMMLTIHVAYTFQKVSLNPQLDPKMFEIPDDYREVFTLDEVRS